MKYSKQQIAHHYMVARKLEDDRLNKNLQRILSQQRNYYSPHRNIDLNRVDYFYRGRRHYPVSESKVLFGPSEVQPRGRVRSLQAQPITSRPLQYSVGVNTESLNVLRL